MLLLTLFKRLAAIAYADGPAEPPALERLLRIAHLWGVDRREARRMLQRLHRGKKEDPFQVLGVTRRATAEEIRRAYRKLVRQYHPDKLPAKQRTPDTLHLATRKLADINAAYAALTRKHATRAA